MITLSDFCYLNSYLLCHPDSENRFPRPYSIIIKEDYPSTYQDIQTRIVERLSSGIYHVCLDKIDGIQLWKPLNICLGGDEILYDGYQFSDNEIQYNYNIVALRRSYAKEIERAIKTEQKLLEKKEELPNIKEKSIKLPILDCVFEGIFELLHNIIYLQKKHNILNIKSVCTFGKLPCLNDIDINHFMRSINIDSNDSEDTEYHSIQDILIIETLNHFGIPSIQDNDYIFQEFCQNGSSLLAEYLIAYAKLYRTIGNNACSIDRYNEDKWHIDRDIMVRY